MKIPTKFHLNTKDYKIYFDNEKKTHICEDLETSEKTNIGVIGTFLQMGILKTIDNNPDGLNLSDDRIAYLMDKVVSLEQKLGTRKEPIIGKQKKVELKEIQPEKPRREPILKKHPKVEEEQPTINQRVMEKILEKTIEEENKEPPKDVNLETEEEIDNWMEI